MILCLQAKPNTTISASDLNTTDMLDFLALPFGPGCYVNHSVINELVQNATNVPDEDERLQRILSRIPHRFAHTFKKPKNAETDFCRANLCSILGLVVEETRLEGQSQFMILGAEDLQRCCNFFLAKPSSKPEISVVVTQGDWKYGIIGAEAKTVDHGYHEAAAQGVSLSADFAMEMAFRGYPIAAVAVPFVLTYSDSVQFGAVYLIEENFPCAVMLSPPLSLLTDCTRVFVAKWITALVNHCNVLAKYLDTNPRSGHRPEKCRIRRDLVFLKPIVAPCIEDASFAATHLLSVFQLLYSYQPCREYIVFPLGQMGMPDDSQFAMKRLLLSLLERKFLNSSIVTIPGCPLIIYPRLGPEWRNCGEHKQHLVPIKEAFLVIVSNIFTAVEGAGVVHLDARLFNFMFKHENGDLSVKLIDWDSSLRMGRHISPTLLSNLRGDFRYPQEDNTVATPSYHRYFFQRIVEELNVS